MDTRCLLNSSTCCRPLNAFISVSSDHRIVTARIRLTHRANNNNISIKI